MEFTIDWSITNAINEFKSLNLGGKKVVTPYFINVKRRKDLRAMVGKGTPKEIVVEAKIWEKLKGVDFNKMSEIEIKQFLIDRGIGIDCSGFIIHILDKFFLLNKKKHIWNLLKIDNSKLTNIIRYKLRPVEQLGAEVITNSTNCSTVNLNNVKPMDLIRSKAKKNNAHHIMIVTKVFTNNNNIDRIEYTHSSPYYGINNGIKSGIIEITDINKPLQDQNWLELDENGICHTKEGYLVNVNDNGIRRLRFL